MFPLCGGVHGCVAKVELDELIKAIEGARNEIVAAENMVEKEIDELRETVMDAGLSNGDK